MAVIVNGHKFVTLDDAFYINGARVVEARLGDGTLVYPRDRKPHGIKIIRPPYKFLYKNKEVLSFDGISVVLVDKRGRQYSDERYPTGVVPFNELIFPVTTVEVDENYGLGKATYDGQTIRFATYMYVEQYSGYPNNTRLDKSVAVSCDGGVYIVNSNNNFANIGLAIVSKSIGATANFAYGSDGEYKYNPELKGLTGAVSTFGEIPNEIDGSRFYYGRPPSYDWVLDGYRGWYGTRIPPLPHQYRAADILLADGAKIEVNDKLKIPVQWDARAYSAGIFEDSFGVKVTA